MVGRSHDIDMNDGGTVFFDDSANTTYTKFGETYSVITELFATLIRVRNVGGGGHWPHPDYTTSAMTNFIMACTSADNCPVIGDLQVWGSSRFDYSGGDIGSNSIQAFDEGIVVIAYANATTPTLNGVNVSTGVLDVSRGDLQVLSFIAPFSLVETTFKITMHDLSTLSIAELPA